MNTLTKNIDYFKQIVKNHTTNEIIELWYKKYGEQITKGQIRGVKYRHKIYSNVKTTFSKERQPKNRPTAPIGTIHKMDIKIADGVWARKNRIIYEQEYGKIPKSKFLLFLDGDNQNCDISNLKLVSRRELVTLARNQLFLKNKELNKIALLIAKLKIKTKEKEGEKIWDLQKY